jgi:ADP-heptose:LPS heptosyltransferase
MKAALRRLIYTAAIRAVGRTRESARRTFGLGILKLDRLGDAVVAIGAMRRLLAEHDEQDTLIIASPIAASLLKAEFPRAEVLVLPAFMHTFAPDYLHFLLAEAWKLQRLRVERLVVLRHQPSDYLHTIAQLLQPQVTIASIVNAPWENISLRYPFLRSVEYPEQPQPLGLELEAHRRLLERVCGRPVALAEVVPGLASVTAYEGGNLLLCPEAGDAARCYSPADLADAVARFIKVHAMPVELCLPPEADSYRWVSALTRTAVACAKVHRPADAVALAAVVAHAGLVLANESAPAHLAAAMDKRGVFILGGGHFGLLAPWRKSERQRWIYNALDCYDCRWSCRHAQRLCITDITPAQVAEALAQAAGS